MEELKRVFERDFDAPLRKIEAQVIEHEDPRVRGQVVYRKRQTLIPRAPKEGHIILPYRFVLESKKSKVKLAMLGKRTTCLASRINFLPGNWVEMPIEDAQKRGFVPHVKGSDHV